jgi:hypothetical protein
LQYWPAPQSTSAQQPLAEGTQWPLLQVSLVHSAALAQVTPSAAPQVLVVALQAPELHTAARVEAEQRPLCRPSLGMAAPAASFAWHVKLPRSQNWPPLQSVSAQQPEVATQWPLALQALLVHWAAAEQVAPLAEAQVFAVALQTPVAHTAEAVAVEQVPPCRPSLGSAVPAVSFAAQVNALRLQYWPLPQSASAQQPLPEAGTQWPLLQVLWVHSAPLLHELPSPAAQVLVVALHAPLVQTAAALDAEQAPPWSPSPGIAVPAACLAVQVKVLRLQYWAPPQSVSAQQAPAEGTQWPLALQALLVHWLCAVHAAPSLAAQVAVVALHAPLAQTSALEAQVPSWSPSLGMGAPAASFA